MDIDSGSVTVDGYYFFRNRTPEKKIAKLFPPFPVDSNHPHPDSVEVEGLAFQETHDGLTFVVDFATEGTTEVHVFYKQMLLTNHATYILTTARQWGEPISDALFTVTAPQDYQLILSYRPDSLKQEEGRITCFIHEEELFPHRELDVSWTEP